MQVVWTTLAAVSSKRGCHHCPIEECFGIADLLADHQGALQHGLGGLIPVGEDVGVCGHEQKPRQAEKTQAFDAVIMPMGRQVAGACLAQFCPFAHPPVCPFTRFGQRGP